MILLAEKKVLEITFEFGVSKTSTQANSGCIFIFNCERKRGENIKLRKFYLLTVFVLEAERSDLLDIALML